MNTSDRPNRGELYAHVRVGACDIAVPAGDIVQAIDPGTVGLVALPRREGALVGMVEFDGSVVPVVALERWLAMGEPAPATAAVRVILLRAGRSLVGIRVDALLGTRRLPAAAIRTVCHDAGAEELFEAIAPATAERPLLCLLEVARLMALAFTWCEAAELKPGRAAMASTAAAAGRGPSAATVRHALFTIGSQLWAVPAAAIARFEPAPRAELRWARRRTCGIGSWGARKVPLVDLAFDDAPAPDAGEAERRWMVVLVAGTQAIGLVVSRGERMLDLAADDIVATPGDEVLSGKAMVAGLGMVSVLDVDRLFVAVPEATISEAARSTASASASATAAAAATASAAGSATANASATLDDGSSHYLVFEADRAYASPVAGVVGVVALPASAVDDLTHGRRATIDWRGQTLGVANLPALDGGRATTDPRIAVIVEGTQPGEARSAIAIRSLTRWLPANTARRSSMRLHGVGDVAVITPPGTSRNGSLVVVDLAQMAYLLA